MENEIDINNIYEEAKKLGVEMDHHQSDLYIPVTPETRELVCRYKSRANVTTFKNQLTKNKFFHELWYDIPFAYSPFWDKVQKESERRKLLESPK
jgi:hypothetical protein